MKLIDSVKNLLAILILSLIILLAIIFLARPLVFDCLDIYKQNKEKRTEIASYDQNIENMEALETQIEDISYTLKKAANFVPQSPDSGDFIVQLEAVAKKDGIAITEVQLEEEKAANPSQAASQEEQETGQPSSTSETQNQSKTTKIIDVGGTEETVISVSLSGKYSQLIAFLRDMRKLARFNIIKNLSIQGTENQITASLYVIIFSKASS